MADDINTSGGKADSKLATAQLDALKKRLERTKAQIMAIEASHKQKARKEDTRLKVLIGAAFLADAEHNQETRAAITPVLQRAITAAQDREFLKEKGWL